MKTKTEKELEREIEFFGGKDFIKKQKGMIVGEIIDDEGLFIAWIKMLRLEGYRLAKEEYEKKVDELKEEMVVVFDDIKDQEQMEIIIDKIFK